MSSVITILIGVIFILSSVTPLQAYDLSHDAEKRDKRIRHRPLTVALVPFANQSSPALKQLLTDLESQLHRVKGVRVLDQKKTSQVVSYYLNYIGKTAQENPISVLITAARQKLLSGDWDAAAEDLSRAEQLITQQVRLGGSNEGLSQVCLLKAKIQYANRDKNGVRETYESLVQLHPDLVLDPNLYARWERKALSEAKESLKHLSTAQIEINSNPKGGEVMVNGIHHGISPLTVKDLPPGLHIIEIKTVHHSPYLQQIQVHSGGRYNVSAHLRRTEVASNRDRFLVSPKEYQSDLEISRMIATLGYHLGVDKVILVANAKESGVNSVMYRLTDTSLGAVYREREVTLTPDSPQESLTYLVTQVAQEAQNNLLRDPGRYVDQSVGSLKLHQKLRPIYKKPLFWVLVGGGAGSGVGLAAVLAGGAAAATTGGILIGL